VETEHETIHAGSTLIAAGAWSGTLALQAGLHRPLTALRRMAAIVQGAQTTNQPWFWLDDVGLYAKPHHGDWLVSPCDESPELVPNAGSSTGQPNPTQMAILEAKIARYLPSLAALPVRHTWTGLRTFAPDRRPLLGADGECEGLWWAAGMGGSGLSSSIGIGQALQAWMQNQDTPWLDASGVRPNRPHLRRWPILPNGDPQQARLINAG
jgi:D-arginine dehydrogenase